jgi:hypothetical protein
MKFWKFSYTIFSWYVPAHKRNKDSWYEQNSIAGAGMSGDDDGICCLVISLPFEKLSTACAVH